MRLRPDAICSMTLPCDSDEEEACSNAFILWHSPQRPCPLEFRGWTTVRAAACDCRKAIAAAAGVATAPLATWEMLVQCTAQRHSGQQQYGNARWGWKLLTDLLQNWLRCVLRGAVSRAARRIASQGWCTVPVKSAGAADAELTRQDDLWVPC